MEKAIKKAIEGGCDVNPIDENIICNNSYAHYLIDAEFWKCLGKSEGWLEKIPYGERISYWTGVPEWQYQLHRFIDWIIEGKDINSFFNELIK